MTMNDKTYFKLIAGISIIVLLVVIILQLKLIPAPHPVPDFTYFLPRLNAFINGLCSILLIISLYFIKRKNIEMHKSINFVTFFLSSIFLISYIVFHYLAPETRFGDVNHDGVLSLSEKNTTGSIRYLYYIILVSHIILAACVLPLILLSFYRGLQMQVELHKKVVRFTFPIWLYVTITGVIVYFMICPYYSL